MKLDPLNFCVVIGKRQTPMLTTAEWRILTMLERNYPSVVKEETITERLEINKACLKVHLSNLRKKLKTVKWNIALIDGVVGLFPNRKRSKAA